MSEDQITIKLVYNIIFFRRKLYGVRNVTIFFKNFQYQNYQMSEN